jgi:hypothetical protein
MSTITLTPELLASVAGILMSLLAAYVPGFNEWFNALESRTKRLVMVGLLLVSSLATVGLSCAGWFDPLVTCDQAGIETVIWAFVLALMANQATYAITTGSSVEHKQKLAEKRARKAAG